MSLVDDVYEVVPEKVPTVGLGWASFPCTDLSLAGSRGGLASGESGAFFGFLDILDKMEGRRPSVVVLENVPGFVSSGDGQDFRSAIQELNYLGYICDAFVLDAIRFVPQSRARLFIIAATGVAVTDDVVGCLLRRSEAFRPRQVLEAIAASRDLKWIIRDLPDPPPARDGGLFQLLEELGPQDNRWWSAERRDYLLSQMSARHRKKLEELIVGNGIVAGTVYRRVRNRQTRAELRLDDISGCLRTPRGGSSRQIVVFAGKGECEARYMTPREYARLMGAGDYPITVGDNQAYFGFGDAVCVPVIEWIAKHYLEKLTCAEPDVLDKTCEAVPA
jgi:DNA (cytosine-5)-methyltransferase 1